MKEPQFNTVKDNTYLGKPIQTLDKDFDNITDLELELKETFNGKAYCE